MEEKGRSQEVDRREQLVLSESLRLQGISTCLLQGFGSAVLPALTYAWVYWGHASWSMLAYAYTHWIITSGCAFLGIAGFASQSTVWLAMHVAFGGAAAAALAAYDTVNYILLDLSCSLQQSASAGCSACTCAATDTCTAAQLDSTAGCSSCAALPADFCALVRSNISMIAVTGLVTLVTMAPPVALSLLLLVRREASAGMRWEVLQRARASVLQQCGLLDEGRPLTIPVSALAAGVRVLQDSGDKACLALAARAIQLLQRSAPQPVDPYGPATPSGSGEPASGSLGSSLYDPVEPGGPPGSGGPMPQQLPGSRPARTGSLLGGASSLPVAGACPLLRFSGEPGGRARSLPDAPPPARGSFAGVSSAQDGGPRVSTDAANPQDDDRVAEDGLEKQQHRHHRRTHHQRDKARKMEELANVAGVYGVRSSSPSQFSPAAALT